MIADRLGVPVAVAFGGLALVLVLSLGGRTLRPRADFAFCNQNEISSLDPAIATGVPESRILTALFEGLVRPDPRTGEPLPGMAERWTTSADGLLWTFTIRQGSTWTNGEPVTAHDFEFSMRRFLHPRTAGGYADIIWCVEGAKAFTSSGDIDHDLWDPTVGIEATSDRELVIRLDRPTPHLLRILALFSLLPVNRTCVEQWGNDWIKPEHIVTNGPFRLVDRRVRDHIRMERWDGYWGVDEVALTTIDAYAADGNTTQLNMYLTGQVDWMVKPPTSLYASILPRDDCLLGPQAGMTFMRFNTTRPPFDDPRVREAMALALDREGLARDVMRGGELPAVSFVPAGIPGYETATLPPRDTDRARALLAEAGYPDGKDFPVFEVLFPHNEITRDFCEAVASQWRSVLGLRPRLVNQAWKVYLDSTKQLEYDVAWGAWTADYLDPTTFLDIMRSGSGNNRTGWADARYDALLLAAAESTDPGERIALLRQAEQRLLDGWPIALVYQRINLNLVAPTVRGFHDNVLDVHPLRDISVERAAP
ncbi:MAG: peptide ABC transporter substrate-binding protein [Planctomycetota bacterium]|jgi:oligopeptide transport system substrate-binding protein